MKRQGGCNHPDAYAVGKALACAKRMAANHEFTVWPGAYGGMEAMGIGLFEVADAIAAAIAEVRIDALCPVKDPYDPPGHAFTWDSVRFGRRVYLKFRLEGRRPRLVIYSLHEPVYGKGSR